MRTPCLLRQATTGDALCLSVLATQVFLDTYATNGISVGLAKEALSVYTEDAFRARLGRKDVEIVVAERDECLIAFADMTSSTECPAPGVGGIEVSRLYVQAPFHGQGIGRELMAAAERRAREQGKSHVWLTAWSGNHRALAFYKRLKYQDAGVTEYIIEGKAYENRVLVKCLAQSAA